MRVLATIEIVCGVIGLTLLLVYASSSVSAQTTPSQIALSTAFCLVCIAAGALLLRRSRTGFVLSVLTWALQMVQVITTRFTFRFLAGPTLQLRLTSDTFMVSPGVAICCVCGSRSLRGATARV